jgi:hypothetical protein
MSTRITSMPRTRKVGRRSLVIAACGAVLALTAIGTWKVALQGDARPAAVVEEQASTVSVAVAPATTAPTLDFTVRDEAQPREILAVFITGSREQTAFVQDRINQTNLSRAGAGQPPLSDVVVMVQSAEDEGSLQEWIALVRREAETLRLPGVVVFDLR